MRVQGLDNGSTAALLGTQHGGLRRVAVPHPLPIAVTPLATLSPLFGSPLNPVSQPLLALVRN
jgi:hypothetical protein